MSHEIMYPPFDEGSYGQSCVDIFDDSYVWHDYEMSTSGVRHWMCRQKEAVEYPYKYCISEFGANVGSDEDPYIMHGLFCVMKINMFEDDSGLRKIDQWFISIFPSEDNEQIDYLTLFATPTFTDESRECTRIGMEFALTNGMSEPNSEDLLELSWALDALKCSPTE